MSESEQSLSTYEHQRACCIKRYAELCGKAILPKAEEDWKERWEALMSHQADSTATLYHLLTGAVSSRREAGL